MLINKKKYLAHLPPLPPLPYPFIGVVHLFLSNLW